MIIEPLNSFAPSLAIEALRQLEIIEALRQLEIVVLQASELESNQAQQGDFF